jgi:hypothetical protein
LRAHKHHVSSTYAIRYPLDSARDAPHLSRPHLTKRTLSHTESPDAHTHTIRTQHTHLADLLVKLDITPRYDPVLRRRQRNATTNRVGRARRTITACVQRATRDHTCSASAIYSRCRSRQRVVCHQRQPWPVRDQHVGTLSARTHVPPREQVQTMLQATSRQAVVRLLLTS